MLNPPQVALAHGHLHFSWCIAFHSWTKKALLKYGCGGVSRQNQWSFWNFSFNFMPMYLELNFCEISFLSRFLHYILFFKKDSWRKNLVVSRWHGRTCTSWLCTGEISIQFKIILPFCKGFLRLHVHAYKQGLVTMP